MPADLVTIEPHNAADDVVAMLEAALVKARNGEISSVGIAFVYRRGDMGAMWSTIPSTPMLLGAVARLAHKLNLLLDDTTVENPSGAA